MSILVPRSLSLAHLVLHHTWFATTSHMYERICPSLSLLRTLSLTSYVEDYYIVHVCAYMVLALSPSHTLSLRLSPCSRKVLELYPHFKCNLVCYSYLIWSYRKLNNREVSPFIDHPWDTLTGRFSIGQLEADTRSNTMTYTVILWYIYVIQ